MAQVKLSDRPASPTGIVHRWVQPTQTQLDDGFVSPFPNASIVAIMNVASGPVRIGIISAAEELDSTEYQITIPAGALIPIFAECITHGDGVHPSIIVGFNVDL